MFGSEVLKYISSWLCPRKVTTIVKNPRFRKFKYELVNCNGNSYSKKIFQDLINKSENLLENEYILECNGKLHVLENLNKLY